MEIDIDHELDAVERKVEQTEQRVGHIGAVTGTAEDGAVAVTVRPGGMLAEVRLSPAALRDGSAALAARITALTAQATRRAGAAMHATLSPVLGRDGEHHLTSLGYEPLDEEDDPFDNPLGLRPRR